ncbi:hypothetical protein Tco_0027371 [Tanacetum coccineum]
MKAIIVPEQKSRIQASRSRNDATCYDADIRPINNESQWTKQHTDNTESINEKRLDQNAKQCHDIRPLPAKLTDDKTIELSDQSLESENVCLKKIVAQYIVQSYRGRTQSLVAKKKDISENRASRNFDLMITK